MNLTNIFEYNQHFVAMMNIINRARLNPPVKGHKHHIIPRYGKHLSDETKKKISESLKRRTHNNIHNITDGGCTDVK